MPALWDQVTLIDVGNLPSETAVPDAPLNDPVSEPFSFAANAPRAMQAPTASAPFLPLMRFSFVQLDERSSLEGNAGAHATRGRLTHLDLFGFFEVAACHGAAGPLRLAQGLSPIFWFSPS